MPLVKKFLQFTGVAKSVSSSRVAASITIQSKRDKEFKLPLTCNVLQEITSELPQFTFNVNNWKIPIPVELADPEFNDASKVDLLIGADGYFDVIIPECISLGKGLPMMQNTKLGWIIGGRYSCSSGREGKIVEENAVSFFTKAMASSEEENVELDRLIVKFWETEDVPESKTRSAEAELAEKIFKDTTKRVESGMFQVDIPLKEVDGNKKLGDSYSRAYQRFRGLEKRFQSNINLYQEYKKFIDEYVSLGHGRYVNVVTVNSKGERKFFLPHHCIIREQAETTKLRVVFDASSKSTSGYSLNDVMLKGYQVQPELYDILCRFRMHKVVFVADIKKMYRQILINPKQCYLQNILWREKPDEQIRCIELSTVTYGTNCAPFLATRVLTEIGLLCNKEYPAVADALISNTYVDDVLYGCSTFKQLEEVYKCLNLVLGKAKLELHKWCSNSSEFRKLYAKDIVKVHEFDVGICSKKVLGVSWNPVADIFAILPPEGLEDCSEVIKRKAFLFAFKRFISRRGNPSIVYSDNGMNFVGAKNKLHVLYTFLQNQANTNSIVEFVGNKGITWKFIPPHSPHWGGIWEAGIKSTKSQLARVIGTACLTFEELSTVLTQIEAILNLRPLSSLSNDPADLECLTPGHFLIGQSITAIPEVDVSLKKENRLDVWNRCCQLQQQFWKRWSMEYLSRLQHRPKWLVPKRELEVNELVLIKEDAVPPLHWPRGRVTKVIVGSDGRARAVQIKTVRGEIIRPITKICPLLNQLTRVGLTYFRL